MRKTVRLYNIILPVWLLWIFPQVWLVVLPGNLAVDTLVLFLTLAVLRCPNRGAAMKRLWWRVWGLGFLADAAGVAFLALGMFLATWGGSAPWAEALLHVAYDPFGHPLALAWALTAVGLSGLCIYALNRQIMDRSGLLTEREAHRTALVLAIVTAPWTFLIPVY